MKYFLSVKIKVLIIVGLVLNLTSKVKAQQPSQIPNFRNPDLSIEIRVRDLLSSLTIEEKIGMLGYQSSAVPRLNIPTYNWWNEALHGVARAGNATVFPQAIALAATFNDSLICAVGDAISTEARAKFNEATSRGSRIQYMGLTFWSPNINIFRDPRWGRGQETYGEDPFLTASMGTAFVRGLQGNNVKYLKVAACAKHFAVHSGPEAKRHSFNAVVDEKDLRETYLFAFSKLVDANVEAVMCAYNRLNGEPCCSSENLLQTVLRKEWNFKGHILTDCWALDDIYKGHGFVKTKEEAAAVAIKSGVNLDCSELLQTSVASAIRSGLLSEIDIDKALSATLRTHMRLGLYDNPSHSPFSDLREENVHSVKHVSLSRYAAQQSIILLKNSNKLLPLRKESYKSVMVIGPNAASISALTGNYSGMSGEMVTFVEGIVNAAGSGTGVQYDQGCDFTDTTHFGGIWAAGNSDVTIAVVGLTPELEGEEHDAFLSLSGGDKKSLHLPRPHTILLQQLKQNKKPLIVVVTAGSNVDIAEIEPYADAILLAWYPGEQGGHALADILYGKVSPSGKLPITFYSSLSDLPPYDDYSMKGRTYRYFNGKVQYPFGYGLSYTTFSYQWHLKPKAVINKTDTIRFSIAIENIGEIAGDEVVQVYVQYPAIERMPQKELKAFRRLSVKNGEQNVIQFALPAKDLQKWDMNRKTWVVYPGTYKIGVGSNANDFKLISRIEIQD